MNEYSVYDNRMSHEKPCRACTDFKTWAKSQKKTFESTKVGIYCTNFYFCK